MELEKIRQSDSEVRWQHDEDVLECNSCKKTFQNRKEKVSLFLFYLDLLQMHKTIYFSYSYMIYYMVVCKINLNFFVRYFLLLHSCLRLI